MKFLKEVADYNSPRITKLASIYWDKTTGEKDEIVLLSLWCGIGTDGPIDRIEELVSVLLAGMLICVMKTCLVPSSSKVV